MVVASVGSWAGNAVPGDRVFCDEGDDDVVAGVGGRPDPTLPTSRLRAVDDDRPVVDVDDCSRGGCSRLCCRRRGCCQPLLGGKDRPFFFSRWGADDAAETEAHRLVGLTPSGFGATGPLRETALASGRVCTFGPLLWRCKHGKRCKIEARERGR